jgi:methionine sulfoxide reductase heme-binding subunit
MHTTLTPYLLWVTSRAAGIAALVLASLAVSIGLLMSTKLGRGRDLRVAHEALSLATLAAIVVHGLALLGDGFLNPSLADIAIPFAWGYDTFWTSLGILSGWALALLGLGYYFRARIGVNRWRTLHRFTALAWVAGLAHSLGEGTDAGQAWLLAMIAIVVVPALALLIMRWGRMRPQPEARMRASAGARMRAPEQALQTGRVPDHEAVELAAPLRPAGAGLG